MYINILKYAYVHACTTNCKYFRRPIVIRKYCSNKDLLIHRILIFILLCIAYIVCI